TDSHSQTSPSSRRRPSAVVVTIGFVVALYLAWTGAWILLALLEGRIGWPASSDDRTLYWILLKVLLWILPGILIFRYTGVRIGEAFRGNGARSALLWGAGAGLLIGFEVVVRKWIGHQPYRLTFNWSLVNVVLI